MPVLFIAMKWLKNSGIKPQKNIRSAFEKQQPALTSGQLHSIKVHTMVKKEKKYSNPIKIRINVYSLDRRETLLYSASSIQKWWSFLSLSISSFTDSIIPIFFAFINTANVPDTGILFNRAIVLASLSSNSNSCALFSIQRHKASASPRWRWIISSLILG